MPSIVDPALGTGGAWTATAGLTGMLGDIFPGARIEVLALREYTGAKRRWRQAVSVARGLTGPYPAKVAYAVDGTIRAGLRRADLNIVNGCDLLWTLPYLPAAAPTVVVAHNLEHKLFAEQAAGWGMWARWETARYKRFEYEGLARAGHAIFLSPEERDCAAKDCPGLKSAVIPPVFLYEGNRKRPALGSEFELLLVSNLHWWPNAEGLQWFLRHVWPAAPGNISLRLCGPGTEDARWRGPRVTGHGIVADLRPYWERAHTLIAPMQRGAGIKVKIAEALHNSVPVLATPAAARGLLSSGGVMVRESAADWVSFLRSAALREWAAEAVPDTARQPYSRSHGAAALADFLAEVSPAFESACGGTRRRRRDA